MKKYLCDYGCGQEAAYQLKNGKWCCSKSNNSCPSTRKKNSEAHIGDKNIIRRRPELKKKISESLIGRSIIDLHGEEKAKEIKNKIRKNYRLSSEGKNKKSIYMKNNNPMYFSYIKEKHRKIMREKMLGENNHSWKGGTSWEKYCPVFSDKEFREYIYWRDNNTCQLCGCTKQLSYKLFGRMLSIHHINHNKKDCDPSNVILVCSRCNGIVEGKEIIDIC